ncbi:hypothetical protein GCK72_007876 [Caenorhabditis remanei]|uniref:DUF38 domain-containing protein n=1 Tax=Caenorhabditis remanei TaxID=31234 RepID=A0A6A5HMM7_CAERE|nr:hypothetical protein GCK72_007876 [Caenorhabditis remanei]KAF1767916.1 hypothetical protein GCK72_007876 [Caenorhabditis remanei]
MPFPLSYPGLQCILEHLEAVKRAHIIGRAPSLQKIDKLIPLRLGNLTMDSDWFNNKLTINKLSIKCKKDELKFERNGKKFSRQISVSLEVKMKKLINYYISGRSKILVDKFQLSSKFHVHSLLPDLLPANLKFRLNFLDAVSHEDFQAAISFIDTCSFPLKTVVTIPQLSTFDNQVVKLAETLKLNLGHYPRVTVEDLKKLNNKTVVFEHFSFSRVDIIPLIKYHIETKKDIRTTFVISTDDKDFINEMLSEFEQAFGEFRCDLDGVNERFIPESPQFSIPINNESRIQVYALEVPEDRCRLKIVIRPVSEVLGS